MLYIKWFYKLLCIEIIIAILRTNIGLLKLVGNFAVFRDSSTEATRGGSDSPRPAGGQDHLQPLASGQV
jgi:hypothetical protein